MKYIFFAAILLTLAISRPAAATDELRDPRTRNEDISGATVAVDVVQDASGLYRYNYTITNPPTSVGKILTFWIDVGCSIPVPAKGDLSSLGMKTGSVSESGNHVPVALTGAITDGVSAADYALWLVSIAPGRTKKVGIVSGYGPGPREFKMEPYMDPVGWDYETYSSQTDPSVPWTADFTVTGFTRGPACPGDEEPVEPPRFAGTRYPNETEAVNSLLTYSEPLRDRFHAEVGTESLTLTIHYAEEIDPKSFRVLPAKHNLRRFFHPEPGTSETVTLPLEPGKNKIQLQAKAKFLPRAKMKEDEVYGGRGPDMDQDDFEVRVGAPGGGKSPSSKAKGKK